jgi:hypothetical protein
MAAAERAGACPQGIVFGPLRKPKTHMNVTAVTSARMIHGAKSRDRWRRCQLSVLGVLGEGSKPDASRLSRRDDRNGGNLTLTIASWKRDSREIAVAGGKKRMAQCLKEVRIWDTCRSRGAAFQFLMTHCHYPQLQRKTRARFQSHALTKLLMSPTLSRALALAESIENFPLEPNAP